jgi:hypothetical protein
MGNDNVVDITDRGKLMSKMVGEDAVQLIEMGSSGENFCLTLSKSALMAVREGRSFPLDLLMNGKKVKITVMRDNTYKKKLQAFLRLNEQAKDAAQSRVDLKEDVDLGKSLGEKLDQE